MGRGYAKRLALWGVLVGTAGLAACGGGGTTSVADETMPTYADVRDAVCEDRLEDAQGMLVKLSSANGGAGGEHRLLEGYVQEKTGRLMAARASYGAAGQIAPDAPAKLDCGSSKVLLSGTVGAATMARVAAINATLAGMDVTPEQVAAVEVLRVPPPPAEPEPDDEARADEPPVQVIRPRDTGKASGIWIHLASYANERGAGEGWAQLEKRFPALASYKPVMRSVKIPGKGTMVRLGAIGFAKEVDAQDMCKTLKGKRQYCMLRED